MRFRAPADRRYIARIVSKNAFHLDEAAARRVLMVQAFETGPADGKPWTAEDRALVTRLARETTPVDARPERYLDERARHALHMLAPRDKAVARWLDRRLWRPGWTLLALLLGAVLGLAADALGGSQHINLLAPPVWVVMAWNLLVYLSLLLPVPKRARAWLARRLARVPGGSAPLQACGQAWARHGWPLAVARAALLLHLAAAALAAGLVAGLYLRGLVLDFRAGWQSTFLDAATVQTVLATLLAPAVAATGIALPDAAALEALRVGPQGAASASAAPWIHLYAAMLALFVVAPRLALAVWAAARSRWLARHVALPKDDPLGLRALLAQVLGPGLQMTVADATSYGNEEAAAQLAPETETTLRLALVDLGTTPEEDTHGRFLQALRQSAPGVPLLLLADSSDFDRRFAATPARGAERRAAWQQLAAAHDAAWAAAALNSPAAADETTTAALEAALSR